MAEPGSVSYNADFKADTSQGQQSLKDYQTQIKAVKAEIAQATREAKESFQQQMLAARASGKSYEDIAKIQQQYSQQLLAIKTTQKDLTDQILKGNFSAMESEEALKKVRVEAIATIEKEALAIRELAAANAGHTVTGQSAASGAVQLLDGRGGIRTIENFLGNTLGLGGFFSMMFPVVGAIQSGKLLYDLGEKVYDVGHKASKAGEEITIAFDAMHNKSQVAIDDLAVQADKIQLNIDKLSGHPGDGLTLALDEARVYADKLQASLAADRKELAELLKEHNVGFFGSILSGVAATGKQEKEILRDDKGLSKRIAGANDQYLIDAASGKPEDIKAAEKKRTEAIRAAYQTEAQTYRTEAKRLRDEEAKAAQETAANLAAGGEVSTTVNNSAKIANAEGVARFREDQLKIFNAQHLVGDVTQTDNALKGKKEVSTQAAEARRKATEAQKEAATAQKQQWDDDHAAWEAAGKRSTDDEVWFWIDRANAVGKGSLNYVYASRKADEGVKKANDERRKVFDEGLKMAREFNAIGLKDLNGGAMASTRSADAKGIGDAARTGRELLEAQQDAALTARQATISFDLESGAISRYDAAVQLQTLHADEYSLALQRLKAALDAVPAGPEADAERNRINKQIVELDARRSTQKMQDSGAVANQTVAGALKQANQQWLQDTQNLAPQLASVYTGVFSGMNSQLANLLTGQKTSWGSFFSGIAQQVAKIGLNNLEALGMSALSTKSSSSSSSTGSVMGGLVRGIFGGFRAKGGPVEAGKTYIVGEHGPEPVTFGDSGMMGTNRDYQAMQGSGTHHWNIDVDARGASNPAEVEAAANRAIARAAPAIVAASMQAQRNERTRTPNSRP